MIGEIGPSLASRFRQLSGALDALNPAFRDLAVNVQQFLSKSKVNLHIAQCPDEVTLSVRVLLAGVASPHLAASTFWRRYLCNTSGMAARPGTGHWPGLP